MATGRNNNGGCRPEDDYGLIGVLLAEFHPVQGPRIRVEVPVGAIWDWCGMEFESVSEYIIPKKVLCNRMLELTLGAKGIRLIGFPICIEGHRYDRNAYFFNLCFVIGAREDPTPWRKIVWKLARFIFNLEGDLNWLSSSMDSIDTDKDSIVKDFIWTAYHGLLSQGKVLLKASNTDKIFLQLSQVRSCKLPSIIEDESVPILLYPKSSLKSPNGSYLSLMDITVSRVVKYINGIDTVFKIAEKSNVSPNLLKQSLQTLIFYDCVKLIETFQFANVYILNQKNLQSFFLNSANQTECMIYVTNPGFMGPSFASIFKFYLQFRPNVTAKEVFEKTEMSKFHVDIRKMVVFGRINEFLEKL